MLLTMNKSYLISTKKQTIQNEKVKIVGFINYEETSRVPYNLMGLVNNEQVVETDEDTTTYLQGLSYYKCESVDTPGSFILLWDDIIDRNTLTELSDTFELLVTAKLNINSLDFNINDVKTALLSIVEKDQFKNKLQLSIRTINSTSTTTTFNSLEEEVAAYKDLLEQYKSSIETFIRLESKSSSTVDKLSELNMTTTLPSMASTLQSIYDLIKSIETKVS